MCNRDVSHLGRITPTLACARGLFHEIAVLDAFHRLQLDFGILAWWVFLVWCHNNRLRAIRKVETAFEAKLLNATLFAGSFGERRV
jgi:hypothetical protein